MKIILSGYGKMNREVEKVAIHRGHEIIYTIDKQQDWENFEKSNTKADCVIDFSMPEVAVSNFVRCFEMGLPVVTGTTGWLEELEKIKKMCQQNNYTFFYAPNFSIGVNLFFHLNKQLATIMDKVDGYTASVNETHHIQKLDAPSGTALKLVNDIIENTKRYSKWTDNETSDRSAIEVRSERIGVFVGTHEIVWESEADKLILKHEAKNRSGFALGAVLAAEFLHGKTGVYTMDNLLNSIF